MRLSDLWNRIDAAGAAEAPLAFREEFQAAETSQRTLLADASTVADLAADETSKIESKGEKERSDEERMRLIMLSNMEKYGEPARSAMADARHLLSRLLIEKAHGRVDAALDALRRAREQVQDPVTVLRGLVEDQVATRVQTAALDQLRKKSLKLESGELAKAPVWLDAKMLEGRQVDLDGRLGELRQRLQAGVEHGAPESTPDKPADPRAQEILEAAREALPPLETAAQAMTGAREALGREALADAAKSEDQVLAGLVAALERFSDLRGLIELAHGDQQKIVELLAPGEKSANRALATDERVRLIGEAVEHNRDRLARLQRKFQTEEQTLAQAPAGALDGGAAAEREGQRQLFVQAEAERQSASQALESFADQMRKKAAPAELTATARLGLDHIENLRRLFFSIVEHLKELYESQGKTHDRTAAAQAAKSDTERQSQLAPAADSQAQHAELAAQLTQALRKQADQAAQSQKDGAEASKRLGDAAGEVDAATQAMQKATGALKEATGPSASMSIDFQSTLQSQKEAMAHVQKAIELLSPPEKSQNQDQKQQKKETKQVSNEQAERQLQEIREREAARQRDRQKQRLEPEPVEKDW
jgi:hypothetical protein